MASSSGLTHSTRGASLADVLERILDKGLVIAGDIKIKLVDTELLTIQVRLLVASVDKAREIGIDWWTHAPYLTGPKPALPNNDTQQELEFLRERVRQLEQRLAALPVANVSETTIPASQPLEGVVS